MYLQYGQSRTKQKKEEERKISLEEAGYLALVTGTQAIEVVADNGKIDPEETELTITPSQAGYLQLVTGISKEELETKVVIEEPEVLTGSYIEEVTGVKPPEEWLEEQTTIFEELEKKRHEEITTTKTKDIEELREEQELTDFSGVVDITEGMLTEEELEEAREKVGVYTEEDLLTLKDVGDVLEDIPIPEIPIPDIDEAMKQVKIVGAVVLIALGLIAVIAVAT